MIEKGSWGPWLSAFKHWPALGDYIQVVGVEFGTEEPFEHEGLVSGVEGPVLYLTPAIEDGKEFICFAWRKWKGPETVAERREALHA